MIGWFNRLVTALLACLALSGATGCATPFPERLNWYGDHPYLYAMALGAAAEESLVRATTGQGYFDYMGDAAFTLSVTQLCDRTGYEAYLVRRERGCHMVMGPHAPDCLEVDACASFRYDRALFADPAIRRPFEAGLRRPCDFLTPPSRVVHHKATARFGMSADANWRILLCDGEGVAGEQIEFDDDAGILRVRFRKG
jgi:hypothetical protein